MSWYVLPLRLIWKIYQEKAQIILIATEWTWRPFFAISYKQLSPYFSHELPYKSYGLVCEYYCFLSFPIWEILTSKWLENHKTKNCDTNKMPCVCTIFLLPLTPFYFWTVSVGCKVFQDRILPFLILYSVRYRFLYHGYHCSVWAVYKS